MKNALPLHGTGGNSQENWFPWLSKELEKKDWNVWVPDLPGADFPNSKRYTSFIKQRTGWKFNQESIIVGHSSGAVAALGLLQSLPEKVTVNRIYLVGAFNNTLGWNNLDGLFEEPFDFEKIKSHAHEFIFIHSDNDPYCPLDQAMFLSEQLKATLILRKNEFHFSIATGGKKYRQFPFLLKEINKQN